MKMYIRQIVLYFAVAIFFGCQQPGKNSTGSEFMPEMGHSIAYEANYYNYYYNNTWGSQDEYYAYAKPGLPVEGTIPRGYAGEVSEHAMQKGIAHSPNGFVPYYYGDTEEERTRASEEIIDNPYPITTSGLERGEQLYEIYCGICHGENGDGQGYIAREDGGKYPAQPTNFLLPEFVASSNGRYYHSIMYGKNLMGSYRDKLSYEERWQVIHYIRLLQAKELNKEYTQLVNTLNTIDRPAGEEISDVDTEEHSTGEMEMSEGEHHSDDSDHGDHH